MTLKFSVTVRNGELNSIETSIGTSAVLKIRTGAAPANISDADSGTVLATINLPVDWLQPATAGSTMMLGTWQDTSADNTGTAEHFRLYASNGTTQHIQGTVTSASSGGDMTVDNVSINTGQTVTINTFNLTCGNA